MAKIKFAIFRYFLRWFCEKELDQWDRWQMETKHGDVFIEISRVSDGHKYEVMK